MNKFLKIGDRVQVTDGRIGVVIHVEKDVLTQGAVGTQQLTVQFPGGATQVVTSDHFADTQPSKEN